MILTDNGGRRRDTLGWRGKVVTQTEVHTHSEKMDQIVTMQQCNYRHA